MLSVVGVYAFCGEKACFLWWEGVFSVVGVCAFCGGRV